MLQRILVPLDGSSIAEQVLPIAKRLAQAAGGTVVLVRNVPLPENSDYEASLLYAASAQLHPSVQFALKSAAQYLQDVTASSVLAGVNTEMVTTFGRTSAMIVATAQSRNIDMIVMGGHENTDLKHRVLGSVVQVVTRYAPVPVLVLHDQTSNGEQLSPINRLLRVLIPLDGSMLSEAVLKPAASLVAALASPGQAAIHLVQVVQPPSGAEEAHDTNMQESLLQKAQAYLAYLAQDMQKGIAAELNVKVTWSALLNTHVADSIISTAQGSDDLKGTDASEGCDLIALATHGRIGLQFLALGSVAERVLVRTRLPVLVIRPEAVIGKQTML